MARAAAGSYGVGGDWDLLFGSAPDAQAKAAALSEALRGQQNDALALQALTGGPRAAPAIGQAVAQNAQQEMAGLGQAAQARASQDIQRQHYATQGEQLRASLAQHAATLAETTRHNQATESLNSKMLGGGLSDEAIDQAAEMYHRTGQLPQLGLGRSGAAVKQTIINRAGEIHPSADLAGNKAGYKADTGSLTKQQGILDNTESWERTGKANLGVLQGVAQQLADTGSPWLNKPVRAFLQGAAGDPNMTAFKAAHATVVNEYAKILSGSSGSAAVTDSARKEAEGMIPLDATVTQIAAAAKILDTDAGNRISAIRSQVGAIRGRAGGKAPAAAAPSGSADLRKKYGLE